MARAPRRKAAPRIVRPAPIVLHGDDGLDEAMAAVLSEVQRHWSGNVEALLADHGIEGLHQFRVGLRRFRSALKLFKDRIPDSQRAWLDREARWALSQCGLARDLDVFRAQLIPAVGASDTDDAFAALKAVAARARSVAFRSAARAVRSRRYQRFMIRLNVWLDGTGWRTAGEGTGAIRAFDFARAAIAKRLRKLRMQGECLSGRSATKRHALRIAVKKCRYSLEFVQSLLPKRVAGDLAPILKSVQYSLGHSNDVFTAKTLVSALSDADLKPHVARAVRKAGRALIAHHDRLDRRARTRAKRHWSAFERALDDLGLA
jgi:CHAD domain-containing protein